MIVDFSGDFNRKDLTFYGFDKMTDDEIIDVVHNSSNPELMGSKLGDWMQKRKKNVKKFVSNVKAKYNKLPKWAKIATGVALAPAALAVAPAAMAVVPATLPAVLPVAKKAAIVAGVRKVMAKKALQRAKVAATLRNQVPASPQLEAMRTIQSSPINAVSSTASNNVATMEPYRDNLPAPAVMELPQAQEEITIQETQQPEQKKSILPLILSAAGLALPFLLKK